MLKVAPASPPVVVNARIADPFSLVVSLRAGEAPGRRGPARVTRHLGSAVEEGCVMEDGRAVTELFARLGITPRRVEHPPVHTVEEALPHWGDLPGEHTKNLFLKDGPRLFLVTLRAEVRLDMKVLAPMLGAKRLSFASPERLMEHLGTAPGAVGFLSLVEDRPRAVRFALDRALWEADSVTSHPLRNTATVSLTQAQFRAVLADLEVEPILLDLDGGVAPDTPPAR